MSQAQLRLALTVGFFLAFSLSARQSEAKEYGIAIGVSINDLGDAKLPDAAQDAQNIRMLWERSGIDPANITVLTGERATINNLAAAFYQLADKLKPCDILHFLFSGHGDVGEMTLKDGTMKDKTFRTLLEGLPSCTIDIFIDSCHAGGFDIKPIKGKDIYIIGVVGANEVANCFISNEPGEVPQLQGVGTYFFLKASENPSGSCHQNADADASGSVSFTEAQAFMNKQGPVLEKKNINLIKQTATIKERRDGGKKYCPRFWKGTVTLSAAGQGHGSLDLGSLGGTVQGSGYHNVQLNFKLEQDPDSSSEQSEHFILRDGSASYNVYLATAGGGRAASDEPNTFSTHNQSSDVYIGAGTVSLAEPAVSVTFDKQFGWYVLDVGLNDYPVKHKLDATGTFALIGASQDISQHTDEAVPGHAKFIIAQKWSPKERCLSGSRHWSFDDMTRAAQKRMDQAGVMLKSFDMPFGQSATSAQKTLKDMTLSKYEMDGEYALPPELSPGTLFTVFNAPPVGAQGSDHWDAVWSLVEVDSEK